MKTQTLKLTKLGIIDSSFIALDSTPIVANTSHNNPKSFKKNKFNKDNQPKADKDCKIGVHTASNQHVPKKSSVSEGEVSEGKPLNNEKNYEFFCGYKNHILVDTISGLPLYEITITANIADLTLPLIF